MIDGHVHPAYAKLADQFRRLFRSPDDGGGALAAYQQGHKVLDVWAGWADAEGARPWRSDTTAMSFSTTKGVSATVVHQLVDRGLLDYDEPVATYWPAFAANGKERITVRQLLSHRAGLHNVRDLVEDVDELLDHKHMQQELGEARPRPEPGTGPGYHGFTFGWLVAGLAEAVTGESMTELVRTQLAEPLDLDGLSLGAADGDRDRVARLFPPFSERLSMFNIGRVAERFSTTRGLAQALIVDGFEALVGNGDRRILDAEMPAVNGVFTARSLARLYGALARDGRIDGVQVLSPGTLRRATEVQTEERDYVLGVRMRWRLGYHQAFALRGAPEGAFGHFGYGGSGAWADPATGFSMGFVTNRLASVTTPLADVRLIRLNRHALKAARRVVRTGL